MSLNQWIATAVAQKVGTVETAAEFLKRGAARSSLDAFDDILARVPGSSAGSQAMSCPRPERRVRATDNESLWAPRAGRLGAPSPAGQA